MIDSKADADKNKLSTDTLTYSDIKNEAEWSAETKGANYQKGDGVANKDKGLTPDFAGSEGEDDSMTKSAIAPGEIEIRSDEGKEEKDKTDLGDLSRDPDKANNPLDKIFDKDKILEKQQAAALFGEMSAHLIGELANQKAEEALKAGDIEEYNKWANGGEYRIALHAIAGGLMAEIGGNDFLSGASGATVNELIHRYLDNSDEYKKLSSAEKQWVGAILGGLVTEALTGNGIAGSQTAANSEKNNKHSYERFYFGLSAAENAMVGQAVRAAGSRETEGPNDRRTIIINGQMITINSGHGNREDHGWTAVGLDPDDVVFLITADIVAKMKTQDVSKLPTVDMGQAVQSRWIPVGNLAGPGLGGCAIQYNIGRLSNGTINVGTFYLVKYP